MFKLQLPPDFKDRAAAWIALPSRIGLPALRNARVAPVAGWASVILVGAVMMAHAARENCCAAPSPAPVVAVEAPKPEAPQAVATPSADLAALAAAPEPAPPPAKSKSTERIDMTPTGAIGDPPKPRHKPHKKKPKDLDKNP